MVLYTSALNVILECCLQLCELFFRLWVQIISLLLATAGESVGRSNGFILLAYLLRLRCKSHTALLRLCSRSHVAVLSLVLPVTIGSTSGLRSEQWRSLRWTVVYFRNIRLQSGWARGMPALTQLQLRSELDTGGHQSRIAVRHRLESPLSRER